MRNEKTNEIYFPRYEDETDRKDENKPVGEDFYPLSDVPEIQQVIYIAGRRKFQSVI